MGFFFFLFRCLNPSDLLPLPVFYLKTHMSWKSSVMQTETPARHDKQFSSYALVCRCWRIWRIALKLTDVLKNNPWHTQIKIISRKGMCSQSHLFVSTHPSAPFLLWYTSQGPLSPLLGAGMNQLQMHGALPSPGHLCQEQWLHQTPTPVQGSGTVHSPWWRKHQAEPKSLNLSFARSAHPPWNPTGFVDPF